MKTDNSLQFPAMTVCHFQAMESTDSF